MTILNERSLKAASEKAWSTISATVTEKLVLSMLKRLMPKEVQKILYILRLDLYLLLHLVK